MKHKAFTLIELLVVVAIIGILAAVGVVAYNGYTGAAKKSTTKHNYNAMYKKVIIQIQQCEIQGYVELMIVNNNTTKYKKNCTEPNQNLYGYWIISDMNNSGKSKNPYKATDDAFLKSHFNNAKQDDMVGFVLLYPESNKLIMHACFQTPCSNSSNRLYNEIDLSY